MDHQEQTETPRRGRALVAAGLLCFAAAGAASLHASSNSFPPSVVETGPFGAAEEGMSSISDSILESADRRSLSIALPNGGCQVTYAHLSEVPIRQTWQASFPGSGSRMTWSLVEGLTGIRTNDDYDSHDRGFEHVVAVKTHFPVKDARNSFEDLDKLFIRAMVIFRNPINAIPSYFNLQYEHLNHLPNHSTRGPNEDWIEYRESPGFGVMAQIENYERFVTYWMERYKTREQLLIAAYEDLTDDDIGPVVATRIANFLGESHGVEPIAEESIPCVWQTIVNYKNQHQESVETDASRKKVRRNAMTKSFADPSSLRTGPKVRPYREEHLVAMVAMFQRLIERYNFDEEFVRIMSTYIETVQNTEPSEE